MRWCGDENTQPGSYHVEWTVNETIVWGSNAKPTAVAGPWVGTGDHRVILRGQVTCFEAGAAALTLAGAQILLDVEGSLPDNVNGSWVELFVERESIALYPYDL